MTLPPPSTSTPPSPQRPQPDRLLQGIIEAIRDALIVVDSSMRIVASNRPAEAAFAREFAWLPGRRLSEVIRDPGLHEAFRRAVEDGRPTDLRLEIAGTELRKYDVHIARMESDTARKAIGIFYDVTRFERLERVRQEFLSNISHELRTPLTSILAFVETLEDGAIDDRENNRRFLATIRRNAERMHCLIADILELSLIESGNIFIEAKHVRIARLVDDVFASLSTRAAERDVTLTNRIESDVRVWADPMRLEQMLTNLVDNAIKFNRLGGSVTVSLEKRPEKDRITVSDTGEGIQAAHLPRIFERFYRVDRGRTREVGGTGLGLAIVKHLARLHGGEISISSALGQGTAFTIELPAA
jgi:two-component system phosphate regulon sensor histidine kinase PhoR